MLSNSSVVIMQRVRVFFKPGKGNFSIIVLGSAFIGDIVYENEVGGVLVSGIESVGEVGADEGWVFDGGVPGFRDRGEFDEGFDG